MLYNILLMRNDISVRSNRRRRRHRQRSTLWVLVRNLVVLACVAGVLAVAALVISFGYTYTKVANSMPSLDSYKSVELAQTSTIYDANGNTVDELYGVQNRYVVPLSKMAPTLPEAAVAIEDHRFYKHGGLDFEGIARAAQTNLETMSIQEGGSTITQQLVKNTYIPQNERNIPSFQRKITEASLAWQYDKQHSKKEIIEQYLNTVYFGQNAYGVQAAARTYFNKSAKDLTLPESAMLAGIINLPGTYDPFVDPKSVEERRNVVLDKMLQYHVISKKEHDKAVKSSLGLNRGRVKHENGNEYFLNAVRKELADKFGDKAIYGGGLKVYTTLNPTLQKMANNSVNQIVNPSAGDPSAALVSIDPASGAVKAMVGGSDYSKIKFNLATQAYRQPGSSFKAFVLAEAIKKGISPQTLYDSKNLFIPLPKGSQEPYYSVKNYGDAQRGPISIETAIEQSDNTVFVQLALDLGIKNVVDMAHKLGITSPLETGPATAIGGLGHGVTPYEMASAYSTFANNGEHMKPYLVQKVTQEKDGKEVTVYEHKQQGERALSEDQAKEMNQLLEGVVNRGTPTYFHNLNTEIGRPSAGKTGTTEMFRDAWYVGYIPQLTTSVWVGYPKPTPMINIDGLQQVNGENFPLDIWSAYMQQAVQEYPTVKQFDYPSPSLKLKTKTDGRAYVKPVLKPISKPKKHKKDIVIGGFTFPGTSGGTTSPGSTTPKSPSGTTPGITIPGVTPSGTPPNGSFGAAPAQPGTQQPQSQPQSGGALAPQQPANPNLPQKQFAPAPNPNVAPRQGTRTPPAQSPSQNAP